MCRMHPDGPGSAALAACEDSSWDRDPSPAAPAQSWTVSRAPARSRSIGSRGSPIPGASIAKSHVLDDSVRRLFGYLRSKALVSIVTCGMRSFF
jgi:hypothetical protein